MGTTTSHTGFKATAKMRTFRVRAGLTQVQVGAASGLGQAGVARMETGNRVMRADTTRRLLDAYGLTLDEAIERRLMRVVG